MSGPDNERFREMKEAYALNALSEEERREFEEYLAGHPAEQTEVDELSSVAALLAFAPEEQEPPPELRNSLMARIRSEASGAPVADTGRAGRPHRRSGAWRLSGTRWLTGAAAAVALIGLLVWNVSLQSEVRGLRDFQTSFYELQGSGSASAASGQVVSVGGDRAMLVATDLPRLPEGRTYEMWAIDNGEPKPRGVFKPGEGPAIRTIGETMAGAETFAITVEPEGGSEQPTTDPVVTADLTRKS